MVPEPKYITADEIAAQTLITALANLGDADTDKLIQASEDMIDAHVGQQKHHPDDTDTNRVFPRVQDLDVDGYPTVPYRVSRATLAQVEWLYTEWWDVRATEMTPSEHAVESLAIGGDGSYRETRANKGGDFSSASLCDKAKSLLKGYVSRSAPLSVTDPKTVPIPT